MATLWDYVKSSLVKPNISLYFGHKFKSIAIFKPFIELDIIGLMPVMNISLTTDLVPTLSNS